MNILVVSDSSGKAAARCAAILDSYATRIGERTWAAPITEEAAGELHEALSSSASRSTAVACYRNEGRSSMKLMWIVGSRSHFGRDGAFPIKTAHSKMPSEVPSWIKAASLAAEAAGEVHDLGKFSVKFQNKLRGKAEAADGVRHEWISMKLVQALREVGASGEVSEDAWKKAWSGLLRKIPSSVLGTRKIVNRASAVSTPLECLDFLVATHHGLLDDACHPVPVGGSWNRIVKSSWRSDGSLFKPFPGEMPSEAACRAGALEKRLCEQKAPDSCDPSLYWRAVSVYARLPDPGRPLRVGSNRRGLRKGQSGR